MIELDPLAEPFYRRQMICLEAEAPSADTHWAAGEGEALQLGPILHDLPKILNIAGPVLVDAVVRADFHTERVRLTLSFRNPAGSKALLSLRLNAPDAQKGELPDGLGFVNPNRERGVEPVDDRARRARRREQPGPRADLVSR